MAIRPRLIDRSIMHPINNTAPLRPALRTPTMPSKVLVKKIAGNQISPEEMATLRVLRKMRGQ